MDQIQFTPEEQAHIDEFCAAHGNDVKSTDEKGSTLLHKATAHHKIEVIKFLMSKAAVIDARDKDGETPLHKAARWNNDVEVVKYLVSQGADVRALPEDSVLALTALGMAKRSNTAVAEYLTSINAPATAADILLAEVNKVKASADRVKASAENILHQLNPDLPVHTFMSYGGDIPAEHLRQWCQKVPYSQHFYPKVSGLLKREKYNCKVLFFSAFIACIVGILMAAFAGFVFIDVSIAKRGVSDVVFAVVFAVPLLIAGVTISIPGFIVMILFAGYELRCPSCERYWVVKWGERKTLVLPILQGSQEKNSIAARCKHCGYKWIYEYKK
jgi:hypothetical protein